jgi:hypothetical protein
MIMACRQYIAGLFVTAMTAFSTANAALVSYIVEGDLEKRQSTDSFQLNGSHFRWTIIADAESTPVEFGTSTGFTTTKYAISHSSALAITNRPNGAPDLESNVIPSSPN